MLPMPDIPLADKARIHDFNGGKAFKLVWVGLTKAEANTVFGFFLQMGGDDRKFPSVHLAIKFYHVSIRFGHGT